MNLNLVILVGKEFERRGPVNFRERKPYWVVLDRSDLRGSLPKSVPLDFGLEKTFAS